MGDQLKVGLSMQHNFLKTTELAYIIWLNYGIIT